MYNIHNHYHNIWQYAKTLCDDPRLIYLHPFGSTDPSNIEILADDRPELGPHQRGPLIICYDQEPLIWGFNNQLFDHILQELNITDQRVILLNTERESQDKNRFLMQYRFQDCYSFFHVFAASDWYRGYRFDASIKDPLQRAIKKKYITFNRLTGGARVYRSMLIAELAMAGLIEYGHISYSDSCPLYGHYQVNLQQSINQYKIDRDYAYRCTEYLDKIKFPLRIDSKQDTIPNGSMTLGAIRENMESFLHIVTETCYWEKKHHLTEKIFKPIIARQPFVLLGPANNLAYLKSYGFRTFDRWWDESYDQIQNPIHRLQAVVEIVKNICSLNDRDLTDLLHEMRDTLEHNYRLLESGELLNRAWGELKSNLNWCLSSPN